MPNIYINKPKDILPLRKIENRKTFCNAIALNVTALPKTVISIALNLYLIRVIFVVLIFWKAFMFSFLLHDISIHH